MTDGSKRDAPADLPELSVVVPAYEEEANLRPLYRELCAQLEPLAISWELVIADDGSRDGTWKEIAALHAEDPRVHGIRLSRNFGHQYALFAAMVHARGQAVISLDADLQHPPAVIPRLLDEWRGGSMVVHTVRTDARDTPRLKRATSRLFYWLFGWLSGVPLEPGMADFRLLDRRVVDDLLRFREEGLFLRGLVQWVGFPSSRVSFQCAARHAGTSKYSWRKMIRFAWNAVTSFSLIPLRLAVGVGLLTSTLAFAMLIYAVGAKIAGAYTLPGWASGVSVVSFLFGVLFVLLGVVGEYLGKILLEVRQRPRFLVHECLGMQHEAGVERLLRAAERQQVPERTRGGPAAPPISAGSERMPVYPPR